TPTAMIAVERFGTAPMTLNPCASSPPSLLQPAIQPVARPRIRNGKFSAVYGSRIAIRPDEPMMISVSGTSGEERPCGPASCAASAKSPAVVSTIMVTSDHFVLQRLYSKVQKTIVGAASTVDCAMSALDAPTLLPSETSAEGSHRSSPKVTSPHVSAASVSAVVSPMR